jgi:hypothetical protein
MSASETTICNQALGKLGVPRIIDLDEESTAARICRLHYSETRDEVLRHHRWNFAIKRVELTLLSTPPAFGWGYQFELPTDCLRVIEVNNWDLSRRQGAWEIEGKVLLSRYSTALIRYIARIEDANKFDSLFVEALALKLAAKIAMPINGSSDMMEKFLGEYEKVTGSRARRTDAFEGSPTRAPAWVESDLVFSRFSHNIFS